jgi:hypothetical protein
MLHLLSDSEYILLLIQTSPSYKLNLTTVELFFGACKQNKTVEKMQAQKMLDLLLWGSWFILGAYSSWFLFKAKTYQPLTLDDLALTWKLHKQHAGCKASRIHSLLTKNDKVVGFKCECGHEYLQKRLITQKVRKNVSLQRTFKVFTL